MVGLIKVKRLRSWNNSLTSEEEKTNCIMDSHTHRFLKNFE